MFNFRLNGLQIIMILTFEIFGCARNHGKSSLNCDRPPLAVSSILKGQFHQRRSDKILRTDYCDFSDAQRFQTLVTMLFEHILCLELNVRAL